MSNWVKEAADTDIMPVIARASGWGPKRYLNGVHSAWLLVHAAGLHAIAAWITYSASRSAHQAAQQRAAQSMEPGSTVTADIIGSIIMPSSAATFVTSVAWCLVAYACARLIADAVRARTP